MAMIASNVVSPRYLFNTLDELCEASKTDRFVRLDDYYRREAASNIHFISNVHDYLSEKLRLSQSDYFERIIGSILKTELYDLDKFCTYLNFIYIKRNRDVVDYTGFSHIGRFTGKSIALLIDNLKKNNNFTLIDCQFLDLQSQGDELFVTSLVQFLLEKAARQICYIVRSSAHFTQIFVEKVEPDGARFFITDSLGSGRDFTLPIAIQKGIDQTGYSKENSRLYMCTLIRQKFIQYGCSLFALRDALHISRNPDEFVKGAMSSGEEQKVNEVAVREGFCMPYFEFSKLPEKMMLMTTSLSMIQEYDQLYGFGVEKRLREKGKIFTYFENREINIKLDLMVKKTILFFFTTFGILKSNEFNPT